MDYLDFIKAKTAFAKCKGIPINDNEVHPILKPHQAEIVRWMVRGGQRACFARFGLGKSLIQLETCRIILSHIGGRGLIVCPLGVRQEFIRDAKMIGMSPKFIRTTKEIDGDGLYLTNYESVRCQKLDPSGFNVVSLDEAALFRSMGASVTFREFMKTFEGTSTYRFVATATPDPNEFIELLAYAAFLGIMDVSHGKTQWFKRDSTKADNLTLLPHKEEDFWRWVSTWAVFLQKPSDLGPGFSDEGYSLPPLEVIWHELPTDHSQAVPDKSGQRTMFKDTAVGLAQAAREKKDSMPARIVKMKEIVESAPDDHFIIWHDLEAERKKIKKAVPEAVEIYGTQNLEIREQNTIDFADGKTRILATKASLSGVGCNLQRHCHRAIFLGINYKFHDILQALHRIHRFLQDHTVKIEFIFTEAEHSVREALIRRWKNHDEQVERMSRIIREHGLASISNQQNTRATTVERQEASGSRFTLVNNDSVLEAAEMESDSAGLILTSIPFCYDQETEILTKRGWIGFGELKQYDEVATVNPDRLCFEWQIPKKIVWENYQGEMLKFGNRCFDLLVTPNHRIFAARRGKSFCPEKFHLVEAREISKDYENSKRRKHASGRISRSWKTCLVPPNDGHGDWPEKILIPSLPEEVRSGHGVQMYWVEARDFMMLAGWFLSEGFADSFEAGRQGGRISIAQVTKEKYRKEIQDMFLRIGLPPSIHPRQITVWCRNLAYFLIHQFGTGSKNKRIPEWVRNLHPGLLRILRDTMMKGDGTGTKCYTSFSRELRDNFQEICLKTGWRATIKKNTVLVGSKQVYPEIRKAPSRVNYNGMIGCVTVANGIVIVRRNGKPCVCGNSFQYEYTPSFFDFGHTESNDHFWNQMDFLSPNLHRVLSPGRILAIHVKDRIVPGGINKLGFQTLHPFHAEAIYHYQKHGFAFLGMKTIVTDVVRENNQTYRLGWTEQCKDGSRMGCGVPEYLLLFRKPPTDRSNGYADVPVVKNKPDTEYPDGRTGPYDYEGGKIIPGTGYSRSRWQLDACGFTRVSGNRLLTKDDMEKLPHEKIYKLWKQWNLNTIYDFEEHNRLGEEMEREKRLPATFAIMPPHSWHPDVWTDIARMRTMNMEQERRGQELHLCPMQFDIVERVINQMTNPDDLVFDPFAGLGTVPYVAIKMGRRGFGCELSPTYWKDSVRYCRLAEQEAKVGSLFDLLDAADEPEKDDLVTPIYSNE